MVFASLPLSEQEAFCDLLDEYFSTRPHLLAQHSRQQLDKGVIQNIRQQQQNPKETGTGKDTDTDTEQKEKPTHKALYDFEGSRDGDVSLKKGDLVVVVDVISSDWYRGYNTGDPSVVGIFPTSYVEGV